MTPKQLRANEDWKKDKLLDHNFVPIDIEIVKTKEGVFFARWENRGTLQFGLTEADSWSEFLTMLVDGLNVHVENTQAIDSLVEDYEKSE